MKQLNYFFIHIIVCAVFVFFIYQDLRFIYFINITFFVGGVYVCIGLFLYVTYRQFFDITVSSFQKAFQSKKKQFEQSYFENKAMSDHVRPSTIKFFITQGIGLLSLSIVQLVIYYL